ncbi:unnamed protein product [Diatraea saccharalis]|uniref:Uncharacterized protein n=1 Tax=Diatraea saccharalis TaxID=40085 RepID=A0A9N9QT50_9NEOP|nr:unnamed protein product [Diatraea saccharalis]
MKDFNKSYTNYEFLRRLHNFEESLKEIAQLNELHGSTVFGLTKYSDWSADEFGAVMLSGYSVGNCQEQTKTCTHKRYQHKNYGSTKIYENITASTKKKNGFYDIPEKFDWRERGVVFPVLDQKFCAGCWAFSIVGVMESMSAIRGRGKARLSIQELLDCSKYNNGCKKGNIQSALDFLCHGNTGEQYPIITEEEYPLKLIDETCYDLTAEVPYYIIRNSWGKDFGDNGYLKLAVEGNVCGITDNIAYFNVA